MKNKVLAICLRTYPDETDMEKYCNGEITEVGDVKVYHKGRKYWVVPQFCNEEYFKIPKTPQS